MVGWNEHQEGRRGSQRAQKKRKKEEEEGEEESPTLQGDPVSSRVLVSLSDPETFVSSSSSSDHFRTVEDSPKF